MIVKRYSAEDAAQWDSFVARSKNGTFLLQRGYLDYHADRFTDYSFMLLDERERVRAVLPAHIDGSRVISHGGVTYGGFITGADMKVPLMLEVFECLADELRLRGIREWIYKTVPPIYHQHPAEEDRYALFLAEATVTRRDVLAVIDGRNRLPYQERRTRLINKASNAALTCSEDRDLAAFWQILTANLQIRHGASPTHTLGEIELLRQRFPENIRLYSCRRHEQIQAGAVIYETPRVAHVQYIASTPEGRQTGAVDLLLNFLLTQRYYHMPYFDFGISNEANGRRLNLGLIDQKEGFGARAVVHDNYTIQLSKWRPGQLREALS